MGKNPKPGKDAPFLRKAWYFIWEDDSLLSWTVNIILAFLLIKYIVYPGLGLIFATSHPIVAVVSNSMEHDTGFSEWWEKNRGYYDSLGVAKEAFTMKPFRNGFNRGDIMILFGKSPENIEVGHVMVFQSKRPDPIIHRVVKRWQENGKYYYQTKGDNNMEPIYSSELNELRISQDQAIGVAVFRIPWLGYIKIWFVELLRAFRLI